jgi:hypothetical protein
MTEPPTLKFRHPVPCGETELVARKKICPRPSAWVLLPIYLVWIGFIAAAVFLPTFFPFGAVAGVMFFFIWIPFWAYRNWDYLVGNLAETYATIIVAAAIVGALQIGSWWGGSGIRNDLRLSYLKTNHWWLISVSDNVARALVWAAILSWNSIRNKISARLAPARAEQLPDAN